MKDLDELHLPMDRSYGEDHLWIMQDDDTVKIGLSDYAQDQLGQIVSLELPDEGDEFEQGDTFCTIESETEASDLYLPLSGRVVAINEDLVDDPGLLSQDPYEYWMVEIEPDDMAEIEDLLHSNAYFDMLADKE